MRRDTNADWEGIAGEPYYGVLIGEHHFRRNLTPEALEAFFASGRQDITGQIDLLRHHYGEFNPRTAIDFGCGVGRLTRTIAEIANEHVWGVDAATGMREEAIRNVPDHVEIVAEIPDVQVDWVNSMIVFQHIHPVHGIPLLGKLLSCLAPGGGATIQVGTYKERSAIDMPTNQMDYAFWDGEHMKGLIETPYGSGTMMMYDYDLNQVMAMLCHVGIERFTIQHSNHGGHHGAFILGRRNH